MGARVSVRELISVLGKTYRTIDVRTAAIREDAVWLNAVTVIRLTYEHPGDAGTRLRKLLQRYTSVATEHFKIVLEALPFADWGALSHDVANGQLCVGDIVIRLREPITLEELLAEPRIGHWGLRPFDGYYWPGVYVTVGRADSTRLAHETLLREVSPLGYSFLLEAINDLCEVNVTQGQNPGEEFYLSAPVFAQLEQARLLPFEKRLEVTVRRHADIADLSAIVFFRERNFRMGQSSRIRRDLTAFSPLVQGSPLEKVTAFTDVPDVEEDSWLEIKLVHPFLGEIQQFMQLARMFIPPVERNILFEALRRFCADADLEKLLIRPHEMKPPKLNEGAAFELHVAWLLSLLGLPTILLGQYEHLVAPGTKVERGSVDILAARQNSKTLFLVACTLGPPKEEDFSNLLNVRGILQREVFVESDIRILPVLFTATTGGPSYKEVEKGYECIPIIDTDGLDTLLALLEVGEELRFFEFLGDPKLCALRKPQEV